MADIKFQPTNAQRLIIQRRRRGETQAEAAKRYNVSSRTYQSWEYGERKAPLVMLDSLTKPELFFLLRRDAGLTQMQLATRIGVSELWLNLMENGKAPIGRLEQYWMAK